MKSIMAVMSTREKRLSEDYLCVKREYTVARSDLIAFSIRPQAIVCCKDASKWCGARTTQSKSKVGPVRVVVRVEATCIVCAT